MGCGASKANAASKGGQTNNTGSAGHHSNQQMNRRRGKGPVNPKMPAGPRPARSKYLNIGPSAQVQGAPEKVIFEGETEDQLYQYTTPDNIWWFYNDSRGGIDIVVIYKFSEDSVIHPLGQTELKEMPSGANKCTLVVHPGETQQFVRVENIVGEVQTEFKSEPISALYMEENRDKNNVSLQKQVAKIREIAGDTKDPEEILQKCIEHRVMFIDIKFPPRRESIYRDGIDEAINPLPLWHRPNEYLPDRFHDYVTLFNKIEPNDIDQGHLGDCYLLCALASLAEFPAKVEDAFAHPVNNERLQIEQRVGAYRVTVNTSGWWHVLLLDNLFPTVGGVPCFAKNREDPAELWVQLFEKAMARSFKSYSAIASGDPLQALQDITGYPYSRIDDGLEKAKQSGDTSLFDKLMRWDNEKTLIVLSTPGVDNASYNSRKGGNTEEIEDKYKHAGLALGHAYSVLRVVHVDGHRLLQIRNPWGNGVEWTGAWGDNDPRWKTNQTVASACNYVKASDGTFWMEWRDVLEYFSSGGACFTKFNWFDYRIKGFATNGISRLALEVNVKKRVNAFIAVHQKDTRGVPQEDTDAIYASFIIAVARQDGERQRVHMHSTLDTDEPSPDPQFVTGRDVSLRYTFEPEYSPYVIVPRIFETVLPDKVFVMSIISEVPVGHWLEISFKTLPDSCPVFDNYMSFEYNSKETQAFKTDYQFNPEEGTPTTKRGTSIQPE